MASSDATFDVGKIDSLLKKTCDDMQVDGDFINSALINLTTFELVDPFNAVGDIAAKVLRHTSPAFVDDPLRALRIFQFAGRFGFTVAPETAALCKSLVGKVKFVAKVNPDSEDEEIALSRVWEEWNKWATKSIKPSAGLQALVDMGWGCVVS